MNRTFNLVCLSFLVAAPIVLVAADAPRLRPPLRRDADDRAIPQPRKTQNPSELFGILHNSWLRHMNPETAIRGAADPGALNVNAWDEVPDSTWFTNRIARNTLLKHILSGIPGTPPALPPWTVSSIGDEGYTPKIYIADSKGWKYVLKFDLPANPERNSAAERICTLLMFAAGYNVPLNTIVHFRPEDLRLNEESRYNDALKRERPLTAEEMAKMLGKLRAGPDGRYRGLASLYLPSVLGPFMYTGTRKDDPNDIIPHELRRELRGMRVIASWINHTDTKDVNAMDSFVKQSKESKEGYVRHYMLDFGSTMGSGDFVNGPYRVGHEYIYDGPAMARSFLTLGAWQRPWEERGKIPYPEVGYFQADLFDPPNWKPNYPNLAFERANDADAYWGAKIVTAFSDELISGIVAEGQYSKPEVTRYVEDVFKRRRDAIGRYWLNRITPLEDFRLEGESLSFRDLAVELGYAERPSRSYRATIRDTSGKKLAEVVVSPKGADSITVPKQALQAARPGSKDRYGRTPVISLLIACSRPDGRWATPVEVILGRIADSPTLVPLGWTHAPE